jgi:hypothetical protein
MANIKLTHPYRQLRAAQAKARRFEADGTDTPAKMWRTNPAGIENSIPRVGADTIELIPGTRY